MTTGSSATPSEQIVQHRGDQPDAATGSASLLRVGRATVLLTCVLVMVACRATHGSRPHAGSPAPAAADTPAPVPVAAADAELATSVESAIARLVAADEFSGVVRLSRQRKPLLRRADGFADRETRRPNTVDTPFALASVSKMFTAVVVARLVEQQRISLSATIESLLPGYPKGESSSRVSVHHLLTMSSGIPDLFRSPKF